MIIWGEFQPTLSSRWKNLSADGSYLSWIYPSGKLRKKGCQPIQVRVIEYTIEQKEKPTEQLTHPLITSLLDMTKLPAELLAKEYHQRWEVENTIDELKIHHRARKTHVRSQKPREVVQEVYGCLLGQEAVRVLIFQAATSAEVPPVLLTFHALHYELSVVPYLNFNASKATNFPFF